MELEEWAETGKVVRALIFTLQYCPLRIVFNHNTSLVIRIISSFYNDFYRQRFSSITAIRPIWPIGQHRLPIEPVWWLMVKLWAHPKKSYLIKPKSVSHKMPRYKEAFSKKNSSQMTTLRELAFENYQREMKTITTRFKKVIDRQSSTVRNITFYPFSDSLMITYSWWRINFSLALAEYWSTIF